MSFSSGSGCLNQGGAIDSRQTILAVATARQAKSRTVHLMRQAEWQPHSKGDETEQRIHFFADGGEPKPAIRGAFWRKSADPEMSESGVYHSGSAYFKGCDLDPEATGEQCNLAGQGTSRTL